MSKTPEGKLKEDAAKILKKLGIEYKSFGMVQKGFKNQKKGCPDWLIGYNGRLIWVEWKRPDGVVSSEQEAYMSWIRGFNGEVHVCRSINDLLRVLGVN